MATSPEQMKTLNRLYGEMIDREFIEEEARSRDCIDFKKCYVDVAAGDLHAGLLLSQIIYWFLPNRDNGSTKLRVIKDEKLWLAKSRTDWWDEIRLHPKQFDRAIRILESEGLVETKLYKFNGCPTKHIRLDFQKLSSSVKSISPFRENPIAPMGKMEIDQTDKTLTENTTKTTTKSTTEREVSATEKPDYAQLQSRADSLSPTDLGKFLMCRMNMLHLKHRRRSYCKADGSKWEREVLIDSYKNYADCTVSLFDCFWEQMFMRWESLACLKWAREKSEPVATNTNLSYISKNMAVFFDEVLGKSFAKKADGNGNGNSDETRASLEKVKQSGGGLSFARPSPPVETPDYPVVAEF